MDFLNRTDPWNLYPFLAVLPSGGIFITYYNEARILDEHTFATTKQLPNIPGSVDNFLGGRTYPLEGTAVLLPQHAPYSDPLTVPICGGSTPYAGIALDNCVSMQPEVATEWTIEPHALATRDALHQHSSRRRLLDPKRRTRRSRRLRPRHRTQSQRPPLRP